MLDDANDQVRVIGCRPLSALFAAFRYSSSYSSEANFDRNTVGAGGFYNRIIFKKLQAIVGGQLKLALTGSAPLAPGVQKFVQTAFNCPVRLPTPYFLLSTSYSYFLILNS